MTPYLLDLLRMAVELDAHGDQDGAIHVLQQGLDSCGWSAESAAVPPLTHYLAVLYETQGRPELAIASIRECLAHFPHDFACLHALARLLIETGELREAGSAVQAFRFACENFEGAYQREWSELVAPLETKLRNRTTNSDWS